MAPPSVEIIGVDQICAGQAVSLTAGGNAETYVWNGKDTSASVNETLETSKTYSLKGISTEGCVAEARLLVTVVQNPILSLSGNTTLCQGDVLRVKAHGADSYTWGGGASPDGYPDSMSMKMPEAGIKGVALTGVTGGCSTTQNFEINVKKAPSVQIEGDKETCANVSLPLKAVSEDEITTYTWTNNLNNVSLAGQSVSPVITQDVTYKVKAGNIYGCTDTAEFPIRVVSSPNIAVSADIEFGNPNVQTTLEFNDLGVAYVDVVNKEGSNSLADLNNSPFCAFSEINFFILSFAFSSILSIIDVNIAIRLISLALALSFTKSHFSCAKLVPSFSSYPVFEKLTP